MKKFCIEFHIEKFDFFALTPFVALGDGIAVAWLKWALTIQFHIRK